MSIRNSAGAVGAAGVIAATVAFLPGWEGMDRVARRDAIGTGHPITYCYGQTGDAVKAGTRFTKQQCDAKLAESLPTYLNKVGPCVHVPVPVKTMAALLDASWNAGPAAVCRSPMVARINAGNSRAGCDAFNGWYVRSDGKARTGLIARRAGEEHGDKRKSERALCLEGLSEPQGDWYIHDATRIASSEPQAPPPAPKSKCAWWRDCG